MLLISLLAFFALGCFSSSLQRFFNLSIKGSSSWIFGNSRNKKLLMSSPANFFTRSLIFDLRCVTFLGLVFRFFQFSGSKSALQVFWNSAGCKNFRNLDRTVLKPLLPLSLEISHLQVAYLYRWRNLCLSSPVNLSSALHLSTACDSLSYLFFNCGC